MSAPPPAKPWGTVTDGSLSMAERLRQSAERRQASGEAAVPAPLEGPPQDLPTSPPTTQANGLDPVLDQAIPRCALTIP